MNRINIPTTAVLILLAIRGVGCERSTANEPDGGANDGGDDANTDGPEITCTEPTGGPTVHDSASVAANETWTAADSPHDITLDTTIAQGATLTLEPCARVRIAAGKTVTVRGRLEAPGEPSRPIEIGALDAKPWATIQAFGGGTMSFTWTTLEGGGDPLNIAPALAAMLDVRGEQSKPTQEILHVEHVTLTGSASQGILLREGGGFSQDSSSLTITGSNGAPINIWARAVGTIPEGTYTGNDDDQILLPGSGGYSAILEDTTMHARGVPYHVGTVGTAGVLLVGGDTGVATLTIEPGVTLRFMRDGVFNVEAYTGTDDASGALIAVGTEEEPIVFTSAEPTPAAGDWLGIYFGSRPNDNDRMDYTEVRYAGGVSGAGSFSCTNPVSDGRSEAAIRILGAEPDDAFVTNTLIADSAGYGFDRGWNGDASIDFSESNTFENIAWCRQTSPIEPITGCTDVVVPCP